jgi:hypothetical protein
MTPVLTDATAVEKSGNVKTGPITVTNRSIATCPSTCPFLNSETWEAEGCYGAGRMWHQVNGTAGTVEVTIDSTALMRDRVLGDITVPIPGDDTIDWDYLDEIQRWADRDTQVVFGYTHTDVWEQMTYEQWEGEYPSYVMNVSTHDADTAARAIDLGWPVVLSSDDFEHGDMIAGKRVIDCPQQNRDITCEQCGLCARPPAQRSYIIRFFLHGTQVNKARAKLTQLFRRR